MTYSNLRQKADVSIALPESSDPLHALSMSDCVIAEPEIQAAVRVMRSGELRQGREVEGFENAFAKLVGAQHVVACANGSAALHLAYLLRFRPGDEVLVPALTFLSTASMLLLAGVTPVCVDVDPATWLIDLDDAERRITRKTAGIVPVHLFGNPCNPGVVSEFAQRNRLSVVWDAAQAHGATHGGVDVGADAALVCYSLYATKNITTGEGGLICAASSEDAARLRLLRSHGISDSGLCETLGFNYRMTDIAGAIGRVQLRIFAARLARRRRNAELLRAGLSPILGLQPQRIDAEAQSAWHHYCLAVDEPVLGCSRDELQTRLLEAGIASHVYYRHSLPEHPVFAACQTGAPCPVAHQLSTKLLAIPVHHGLVDSDVDEIVNTIARCVGR
jgi:perosamine synthetase